jgi:hypothetical protein
MMYPPFHSGERMPNATRQPRLEAEAQRTL